MPRMIATDRVLLTPVDTSASRRMRRAFLVFPRPRIRVFRCISLRREQYYKREFHTFQRHIMEKRARITSFQILFSSIRRERAIVTRSRRYSTCYRHELKKKKRSKKEKKRKTRKKRSPIDINHRRFTVISQARSRWCSNTSTQIMAGS